MVLEFLCCSFPSLISLSAIRTINHKARVINMMAALSLLIEAEMKMNIGLKAVIAIAPAASQRLPLNKLKAMA